MDHPILRLDPHSLPQPHTRPAQAARVALEITRGRVRQRVRPIASKVFLIGAASDCDLVLGDLQFPEAYAYVFVSGCRVSIRRLGSGPELIVCGEPTDSGELFHGDLVELGPFELRVLIEGPSPSGGHTDDETDSSAELAGTDAETAGAVHEVRVLLMEIRRQMAEEPHVLRMYDELGQAGVAASRQRASA